MEPSIMLSTKGLASQWGYSVGWPANLRSAGTGVPYVKLGRRVRFRLSDVEAHEAQAVVGPVAP